MLPWCFRDARRLSVPRLTKRFVDDLKPGPVDQLVFDAEMPRFGIRVMPSGVKSYLIQYRKDGRTRRFTFGKHGPLTPEQARTEARQQLAKVDRGENPSENRKQRRSAPTVEQLCQRFLEEHVAHRCKPTTQREYRRSIDLFILPEIGKMKAADVQRHHVTSLHVGLRRIPYQANRTLGVLSKLFNLAEAWNVRPDGSNPTRHVERYKERKRIRFLTPEELSRLGQTLAEGKDKGFESAAAIAAFRLLLLTGCRLREIQTLQWSFVKGDQGV
jgi:integrase